MQEIMKKMAVALSMVAIVAVGSYSFGARAADSTSMNPSSNGQMQQGTSTMPNSSSQTTPQTNIIVPQATTAVPVAAPMAAPRDTLGGLIVLNGLFGSGSTTSTVLDSNSNVVVADQANNDLAGLVAVSNIFSSPYGGGGYGGYAATPAYGGYAASPYMGGGDTLGGLITLNGLFGTGNGLFGTGVNTTVVSDNGTTVVNDRGGMSASAQSLAGLIAVNNLTSPVGFGGGYGGYAATPAYGGYAASPYMGGGDTLGGLITLNGLFGTGANTTLVSDHDCDTDDTTVLNNKLSTPAKDLAGLIAVSNTTSPIY